MEIFLIFSLILSLGFCEVSRSLEDARSERNRLVAKYLKPSRKEEGAIRLVGGQGEWEGNVEIFHNNRWGSICDDEWDESEATVACRQLGYPTFKTVTHSSTFGMAKRRYWMDNLFCEGFERELTHCRFERWGSSDCTSSEAAGVICLRPENKTSLPIVKEEKPVKILKKPIHEKHRMDVRLKGGRIPTEGRVEVRLNNGNWGTICSDGWSLLEANVVCKQLNYGYAGGAYQTDYFGGSNSSAILISGTECLGNETSLSECIHHEYTNGYIHCHGNKNHVASVTCDDYAPDLVFDFKELESTAHIEDRPMMFLQCAMEENCAASEAYRIRRDNHNWHIVTRRLLKFTASVLNAGNIDFRPSIPKHLWEWHMCHMHYHSMEVFAVFDIIDYTGVKVAEGHKASFCLEDNQCIEGVTPKYACANYGDQGISVNCSDIYKYNIDCQWVDISEVEFGEYKMKVSVNPEFKVPEMSFHNNAAECKLSYTPQFAKVYDCFLTRP